MKKIILVLITILAILMCAGCTNIKSNADWGSFTAEKAFSFDNKYYATQTVEKIEDIGYINVNIYLNETDEKIYSFTPARASDFWGICWENSSYNIWTQSADGGMSCYEHNDNEWVLNKSAVKPKYIISKYD